MMKIGMVGLDTSHCPAFTRILNDETNEYHLPGTKVVAAYSGGSDIFSKSRERVQGYTEELTSNYDITLYDDLGALAEAVDAILLMSVDGRQHPRQFKALAVGKPIFLDKPFAVSAAEASAIMDQAEKTGTPFMSCSSLRYALGIIDLVDKGETVVSAEAFGPAAILEDYPGLFWYGIHSAEILFSFMGTGCQQVRCQSYPDVDIITGEWADGRVGLMRGTRYDVSDFGAVVYTNTGVKTALAQRTPPTYYQLLKEVIPFFETGQSPLDPAETFEITAFLEAADRSKAQNGAVVPLNKVQE